MSLWQGDPRWSSMRLGTGASTFGRGGCLLFALRDAIALLRGMNLTPLQVNDACIKAHAFVGSELILEKAARRFGLVAPVDERVTLPLSVSSRATLVDELGGMLRKGFAIVHVDHDSDQVRGDDTPDHFLLCTGMDNRSAICVDPALARSVDLELPDLKARVKWGDLPKTYRAVSVRPLRVIAN